MGYYVPPTACHVDKLGYVRCPSCGKGDHPIIFDSPLNNSANEGEVCDECGAAIEYDRNTARWVRPFQVVRLAR